MKRTRSVSVVQGDISPGLEWEARDRRRVAWDIETSGLDWRHDRIATCQVFVPDIGTEVIQVSSHVPWRLRELLMTERVEKIFHHAMFDLRFMSFHWQVEPRNVVCTKVLSKIVEPELEPHLHSLKPTLSRLLGVDISKNQQVSDWMATFLDEAQIEYAAKDVEYLVQLFDRLMELARRKGLADIAERTFAYLPTRVATDLRGCGDVFAY